MKGKIKTAIHVFDAQIEVDFDAELLPNGSLKLEYHDALIIPKGHFRVMTAKDWR